MKKYIKHITAGAVTVGLIASNVLGASALTYSPYASDKVTFFVNHEATLWFTPSYEVTNADKAYCKAVGKHIKQGWVDYTRNNKSDIDGRVYTKIATSKKDTNLYQLPKKVTATDNLNPFDNLKFEFGFLTFK